MADYTVSQVLNLSLALMDENPAAAFEVEGFRRRAPGILSVMMGELLPLENALRRQAGLEPAEIALYGSLEDPLGLREELAAGVLPWGLAAGLILSEDAARAAFFQAKYEETAAAAWRRVPAGFGPIRDTAGGGDGEWL